MADNAASLANLHDIVVPDPVPWWPPAPGWYVLGLVLLSLIGWAAVAAYRRRRARRYRETALIELAALEAAVRDPETRDGALKALPALLKRTALACWQRSRVASLSDAEWWRFLDDSVGGEAFSETYGAILERIAYGNGRDVAGEQLGRLFTAVRHWIQRHDCPTRGG
jgi:hypothetical protein